MRKEENAALEASSMHIYIRYMLKNMPPSRERGHQPMSVGGKIWQGDKNQRKVWIEKRRKGKILVKRVAVARQRWQENPSSIVSLCIPRTRTADPLDRKQIVNPLDQWDCVVDWNCRASTGLAPSNLTKALTRHCIARRSRTCKERNGTGEGNVWSQLAFHIVGTKPSEVSHCRRGA